MMGMTARPKKLLMHMSFYWGSYGTVVFRHFPGFRTDMYVLALVCTFVVSFLVEWLSHCRLVKPGANPLPAGLVRTILYAVRVGLAYLVMLALMSFNGGVFLVAVAGHALGFFFFGSGAFKKSQDGEKASDLPPMSC
uniref:Copper transport protein n=1 Tax=Rhizophora mucronata TaxID=61149 RepID=A0A2P2P5H5_RHIMU